jgi:hypothetical protein
LFLKVWAYLVGNGVSDGPYKSKNIIAIHSYSSCSREFRNGNGAPDTAETETNIIIIIYIYNTWWWWWRRWWRWWYIYIHIQYRYIIMNCDEHCVTIRPKATRIQVGLQASSHAT